MRTFPLNGVGGGTYTNSDWRIRAWSPDHEGRHDALELNGHAQGGPKSSARA